MSGHLCYSKARWRESFTKYKALGLKRNEMPRRIFTHSSMRTNLLQNVVFTDRLDIYVIVPLLDGADSLDNNFGRVWLLRHLIKTRLVWVQVREGWVLHEKLSWKVKTNTLSKIRKDGRNACTSEAKRGGQHHIGMHVNAYMWGFYYLYSCSVPPSTIDLTVMEYFTRIPSFILLASVSHIS